ncbi:hypothetical protein CKY01_01315 [Photorhabdus laumondii subsp. clarkei]|uniref:Uncharacterized protein n=1 Tax=Photorhabdus laumondii subsp. clarkei TaxID=2029685 RepID=A0A329VMW7_9GAMM|nr:hypothetical protein CKY01_01315 [Photorhabdus laumondii subsp. clarkei]
MDAYYAFLQTIYKYLHQIKKKILFGLSVIYVGIDILIMVQSLMLYLFHYIPVIFQVASLLAALAHPGHIVIYAPGDSLPCRRDAS